MRAAWAKPNTDITRIGAAYAATVESGIEATPKATRKSETEDPMRAIVARSTFRPTPSRLSAPWSSAPAMTASANMGRAVKSPPAEPSAQLAAWAAP